MCAVLEKADHDPLGLMRMAMYMKYRDDRGQAGKSRACFYGEDGTTKAETIFDFRGPGVRGCAQSGSFD